MIGWLCRLCLDTMQTSYPAKVYPADSNTHPPVVWEIPYTWRFLDSSWENHRTQWWIFHSHVWFPEEANSRSQPSGETFWSWLIDIWMWLWLMWTPPQWLKITRARNQTTIIRIQYVQEWCITAQEAQAEGHTACTELDELLERLKSVSVNWSTAVIFGMTQCTFWVRKSIRWTYPPIKPPDVDTDNSKSFFSVMHSTTLHYTTLRYTTFHYTTLHYTTLHYTTSTLHYIPQHYITQHYTTFHYTTLHYNYNYTPLHSTTLHYSPLHYTELHYTTLHHTTQNSSTLHYTIINYTTLPYTTLH